MLDEVRFQDGAVGFLRGVVEGRVTSPLLLVGQEGVGKRFAAHQTVREAFCTGTQEASCPCADCFQLSQGCHPDLYTVAPVDGKDIGVEAVREMLDAATVYPTQAKYRLFLLDGVDRLTVAAANALLKTLEEPPATTRFLLLAETPARVLPTIRSRCGVLNFRPLPDSFVLERLGKFETDSAKALVYARLSDGSLGRAVQYWGSGRLALRDKALSLLTLAQARDIAGVFLQVDSLEKELPLTLRFLDTLVHDALVVGVDPQRVINADKIEDVRALKEPPVGWHALHSDVQNALAASQAAKIQLPFHTKALLLNAYMGA